MKQNLYRLSSGLIVGVLWVPILYAQFGTEELPDRDIGRPPHAPFITFLGIMAPGTLVIDPALPLGGPVSQTLYEELRVQDTPAGSASEVTTSIATTWDVAGRVLEEVRKGNGPEADTVNRYDGPRLISQETSFPKSKSLKPKSWSYWVYDKSGKLIEYRKGSGGQIQNHDMNFKRDAIGRLTSFEYHQGPEDELFSRTELRYSADGKTVDFTEYDPPGLVRQSRSQTEDEKGHVVTVVIRQRDWQTKQMKAPLKVSFRYDEKGRLIEQDTDDYKFDKTGSEAELPPGKISIAYDDIKHTKTTSYAGAEGRLAATVTYNARGAAIGLKTRTLGVVINCTDDGHANWIACEQIVTTPAGDRAVKAWRRTISYR